MIIKGRARTARLAKVRQSDAEHEAMMEAAAKAAEIKLDDMKTLFKAKTAAKSLDP